MSRRVLPFVLLLALVPGLACSRTEPARTFPVKGQVIAVLPDRHQVTLKHEDIPGFMPAMTMNYPLAASIAPESLAPGDLIQATLEVRGTDMALTALTKTGQAPVAASANESTMATALLATGDPIPDAAFVDQDDRRRSIAEWKGTLTLVTFIYTSCPSPTFCPLMDQNFATIQRAVAEDPALKGRVKLLSISFDPTRDTPAVLKAHAAKRGADPAVWTFLTGDQVTVDRFAGHFGVAVIRPDQPGEITHNLRTTLISADGHVLEMYDGSNWTPGTVLADMRAAVKP